MIKGKSKYDALRIYIDELAAAFEHEGYSCIVLDGVSIGFEDEFIETLQKCSFDFVFTCNGILMSPKVRAMMKTRYCTWIFDHPIHHMERLQQGDENTIVLCCDRNNAKYVKEYFPNIKYVDFVPSSGSYCKEIVPYAERKIELVFTGSNLMADETLKKIMELPGPLQNISLEMIQNIKDDTSLTLEDSLRIALREHRIEVNDQQFQDILFSTREVSRYVRAFYRENVIRTIVEAGIPIHVFGTGWEQCDFFNRPNFIQCNGYGETALRAVANAKISLNVMPWFKDGFQERIASSMLNGAVALTDSSNYIEENFIDNENIKLYSLSEIDKIPEIIQHLLAHIPEAERIAQNGYQVAMSKHTYQNRASKIIQILTELK